MTDTRRSTTTGVSRSINNAAITNASGVHQMRLSFGTNAPCQRVLYRMYVTRERLVGLLRSRRAQRKPNVAPFDARENGPGFCDEPRPSSHMNRSIRGNA